MRKTISILVLLFAVNVAAQTPASKDDVKQSQDRLDKAIEGVKRGVDVLVAQRADADQAAALRFQIKELESSKAQTTARIADQERAITAQKKILAEREADYERAIATRDATITTLLAENAAIKKNIKRRALKRILLLRW